MRLTNPGRLLTGADLLATLLFAVEGATAAVLAGGDVFGLLVVAFITALGGGIIRDLVIGDTPVIALRWVRYPTVALLGAGIVFILYRTVAQIPTGLLVTLDACGLGLFCVVGAAKALDHRLPAASAALVGTVTGCGGGVLRDVLLNQVPIVLREQIYAAAALAGAAVMVLLDRAGAPRWLSMTAGAVVAVGLRLLAVHFGWNLPRVHR